MLSPARYLQAAAVFQIHRKARLLKSRKSLLKKTKIHLMMSRLNLQGMRRLLKRMRMLQRKKNLPTKITGQITQIQKTNPLLSVWQANTAIITAVKTAMTNTILWMSFHSVTISMHIADRQWQKIPRTLMHTASGLVSLFQMIPRNLKANTAIW